ncbi:heavy-metal-associated domain-containing protein [Sphingomonas sp. IC-56]|uniref:heavy-metal-associated domain-containing protein n=1 Tax=Sphingomonas sp. IC-56 TaxID=2898529 RepID=UPI001E523706|nr:heavy-metal-associated domain-containing protein [Sphingomonas sp. IC-56]MCD2324890.1 heavy-metal-associated domain-containing protein [Sphingomonas sp. IC-56]
MQVSRSSTIVGIAGALALAGVGGMVMAQGGGGAAAGVAVDASGSFEVSGVRVDVSAKDADAARQGGWRLAQRKGWEMLSQRLTGKKSSLPDSTLDSLSAGIVVEREQIGPNRYIASLGVLFDRARAGAILGVSTQVTRSAPMLLIPLEFSGGVGRVFERETAWMRAWNRFRSGGSTIDYVRLGGTGPDALLINAGQTLRRGRNWWRTVLDQYGASDVLVAEVQLRREYPGGPVVGIFAANHGPDRKPIASFALRVDNGDALDTLLDAGIQRIDKAYQQALAGGLLRTDALLATRPPRVKSEAEKKAEAEAAAEAAAAAAAPSETPTPLPSSVSTASYTVQVDTPNVAALNASESAVRGVPGVRSAATTSLALGGVSVMRVSYDGSIAGLRAALEARGWQVQEGVGVLRIRRAAGPAPGAAPPSAPANPSAATGE